MNDDHLLFPMDDIELLKHPKQVGGWMGHQVGVLVMRCRAQALALSNLRSTMTPEEWAKLDAPMAAGLASIIPPPTPLGRAGRKPRPPV